MSIPDSQPRPLTCKELFALARLAQKHSAHLQAAARVEEVCQKEGSAWLADQEAAVWAALSERLEAHFFFANKSPG